MKKLPLPLILAGLVLLAGCQKEAGSAAGTTGTTPNPATTTTSGGPDSTAGATSTTGAAEAPKFTDSQVPAELKTDAYAYYGLAGTSEVMMEMKSSVPGEGISTGAQVIELIDVKDGEARYKQSWTGPLSSLGEGELLLKKDGLYGTKAAGAIVDPPQMELAPTLTPGTKWTNKGAMEANEQKFTQDITQTVVGPKQVKTPAGTFEAIAVEAKGTITQAGKSRPVKIMAWLVKDIGAVKMVIDSTNDKGKPVTQTLQATKVTKK